MPPWEFLSVVRAGYPAVSQTSIYCQITGSNPRYVYSATVSSRAGRLTQTSRYSLECCGVSASLMSGSARTALSFTATRCRFCQDTRAHPHSLQSQFGLALWNMLYGAHIAFEYVWIESEYRYFICPVGTDRNRHNVPSDVPAKPSNTPW